MVHQPTASQQARQRALGALASTVGHEFRDISILDRALTHASTGNEGKRNYERLEFLGDAFLNFSVADELFQRDPEIPEGQLTEARATLVSRRPLAAIARRLHLVDYLDVGKGLRDIELESERILADLVEAVLGAIYCDGGVEAAREFVRAHVLVRDGSAVADPEASFDSKTALLQFCQRHRLGQPCYELAGTSGLQHEQEFRVRACLPDGRQAEGTGSNKRSAEKEAALRLLQQLREQGRPHEA